jgi:hypothetical protein
MTCAMEAAIHMEHEITPQPCDVVERCVTQTTTII